MKPILPLLAGAAVIAAAVSFSPHASQAQQPAATTTEPVASPAGRRCVVTLDPQVSPAVRDGQAVAPKDPVSAATLTGDLVLIDDHWIILKDGTFENWIPRDKVLSMRVSR